VTPWANGRSQSGAPVGLGWLEPTFRQCHPVLATTTATLQLSWMVAAASTCMRTRWVPSYPRTPQGPGDLVSTSYSKVICACMLVTKSVLFAIAVRRPPGRTAAVQRLNLGLVRMKVSVET